MVSTTVNKGTNLMELFTLSSHWDCNTMDWWASEAHLPRNTCSQMVLDFNHMGSSTPNLLPSRSNLERAKTEGR